ncbi:MAG: Glutaredoxin [Phycisphaerales bacterium]|nr:Glutaredoxin [Phycisphaerales bacterium]
MLHAVKVYGVKRCPGTRRAAGLLDDLGVRYDYFDLDADRHAAAWVRWKCPGRPTPAVLVGLTVLAAPTPAELRAALAAAGMAVPPATTVASATGPLPAHAMN